MLNDRNHHALRLLLPTSPLLPAGLLLLAGLLAIAGCGHTGAERLKTAAVSGSSPEQLLEQAIAAVEASDSFALTVKLRQELHADEGDERFDLRSEGRVALQPLRIDQTVTAGTGGDQSSWRTLLDGEHMYVKDLTLGSDWSRLNEEEQSDAASSLSDYQIAPARQLRKLGEAARASMRLIETKDGFRELVYTSTANSAANRLLLAELLDSTLGAKQMTGEAGSSLQIKKLSWTIRLPGNGQLTTLPLRIATDADFCLDLEAGHAVRLRQQVHADYSQWNAIEPIALPQAAQGVGGQ